MSVKGKFLKIKTHEEFNESRQYFIKALDWEDPEVAKHYRNLWDNRKEDSLPPIESGLMVDDLLPLFLKK